MMLIDTYPLPREEYFSDRLDDQINWYSKKSQLNQARYKMLKIAEMVFAGFIPLSVSLGLDSFCVKVFVALSGSIIVILVGIHGLYNFHENWIEYRSTSETLKHEKYMFLTQSGIYNNSEDPFHLLVERVESIISHENINWAQLNQAKTNANKTLAN